eukprot:13835818-Alexandrium_andersonii.AAC.1
MWGVLLGPTCQQNKVGLKWNEDYWVEHVKVRSDDFGLPQARNRVLIIMIRKDVGEEGVVEKII